MITIEIPIDGQIVKVNVNDSRQAVSFVKGLYLNKSHGSPALPLPNLSISPRRKKSFVEKHCKEIFETLKGDLYNLDQDTGSSQARKGGKK